MSQFIEAAVPHIAIVKGPDLNAVAQAWRHSRPNESVSVDIDKVLQIDAPVNEFARVSFTAYVPILVREIFCSLRDHVVWARTSRVDDLTKWAVFHPDNDTQILWAEMMQLREAGADQDDYRFKLPLGYFTHFSCDLPLRTYLKVADYFREQSSIAANKGENVICDLFWTISEQMRAPFPGLDGISYKARELCPRADEAAPPAQVGSMVFATATVPIALRAQVVRHRMFMIADNISDYFTDASLSKPISSPILMQIAAPADVAAGIVRKRQCWISQSDIWQPLIAQLSIAFSDAGIDAKPPLPCDHDPVTGSECPYRRDNQLRIEGKDPGIPCPIYAQLYKIPLTPDQREKAKPYADKRASSLFWRQVIRNEEAFNVQG